MKKNKILIVALTLVALASAAFLLYRSYFAPPAQDSKAAATLQKLESEYPDKPSNEPPPPPPEPGFQVGRPAKR